MKTAVVVWLGATPAVAQSVTLCTPTGKNVLVRNAMRDVYLWNTELPEVDPGRYDTPEAFLEAIRYRPLDVAFSYVADRAATEALFSDSQYVGFGFSSAVGGDRRVRLTEVYPGSSAADAGLSRGDDVLAIDGTAVATLLENGRLSEAWGPRESGVARSVTVSRGGTVRAVTLVKRAVTIPTVSNTRVFDLGGRRVGYLFFRNFVEPSRDALVAAFAELRAARATELVLDLRYNGGGLVEVAQLLGGLIGGVRTEGQVFAEYAHNDRNARRNRTLRFGAHAQALALDRVVVITTGASASASELVINALSPFMPVVLVGDRTYGKPVGQYLLSLCDKVLAPVSFRLRNAVGDGDFFDGLPAACPAPDDLDRELGDPAEASLREAFAVIASGTCGAARGEGAEAGRVRPQRQQPSAPVDGWEALVGAQ